MKLYEIAVRLDGAVGTPLKGDTLFGQFCWQVAYTPHLVEGGLDGLVDRYPESPDVVFASATPKLSRNNGATGYALKRPDLPMSALFRDESGKRWEMIERRKALRQRKWLFVDPDLRLQLSSDRLRGDDDLMAWQSNAAEDVVPRRHDLTVRKSFFTYEPQPHNSINRLTGTTGTGAFAPYTQMLGHYVPGAEFAIFVLIDDRVTTVEKIVEAVTAIGAWGFGRDASIGAGRFDVFEHREIVPAANPDADAIYCLGPCVPRAESYKDAYFKPFCRFGRHGDYLARSSKPFKNPVVMADEGAVFVPTDRASLSQPLFGSAVTGVSKVQERAIAQGYTVCLPIRTEVGHA